MKNIFIILVSTILLSGAVFADAPNGLAFLKIGTDVRSSAMGDIGVVAGKPASASFYNPALLATTDKSGLTFAHNRWIVDTKMNFLEAHFTSPIHWGMNLISTGVDDIEIRKSPSPEPISTIDSRDLSLGINLAYNIGQRLSVGMGVKYLEEKIFYETSDGWAFDFGANFRFHDHLFAGASVTNLGRMSKMDNQRPELPTTYRAGIAWLWDMGSLGAVLFGAGFNTVREESMRGNFGVEWTPIETISLRGGYLLGYDERTYTAGIGLNYGKFGFDFAYTPFKSDLGNSQRFGLTLDF